MLARNALRGLIFWTALGLAAAAVADDTEASGDSLAAEEQEARATPGRDEVPVWVLPRIPSAPNAPPLTLREEVCDARERVALADERRTDAEADFRRARRDNYPRGVERQLLKEQRIRRRRQADEAAQALLAVEARADDAPFSWQLLEPCSPPEASLPAKPATSE